MLISENTTTNLAISFFSYSYFEQVLFQLRLRGGGPSEEETSQHQVVSVEEEPQPAEPSTKKPLQYGLSKFFGSASEKKAAKPVLELKLPAYTRQGTKSRAQLEAEVAKEV